MIQWLGLLTVTVDGLVSIPGWGTKIPQVTPMQQKKKKKEKEKKNKHERSASVNLPLVNFYPYLLSLLKELKEQHPFEDAKVL